MWCKEPARSDFSASPCPWEDGGAGADFLSYVMATEELAAGDAGLCNLINASNSYGLSFRLQSGRVDEGPRRGPVIP